MAVEKGPKLDWTVLAGADLTQSQYKGVKFNGTSDQVIGAAAATDYILGVLNNAPAVGEEADVTLVAAAQKVHLGGTVALNDPIGIAADGRFIKATVSGTFIVGRALEAGTADQIIAAAINAIVPVAVA